jgi:hypothetical protein
MNQRAANFGGGGEYAESSAKDDRGLIGLGEGR